MTQTMQESTGLMWAINLLPAPILMVPIFVLGIIATLRNLNFWQLTTLDGIFIIQVSFYDNFFFSFSFYCNQKILVTALYWKSWDILFVKIYFVLTFSWRFLKIVWHSHNIWTFVQLICQFEFWKFQTFFYFLQIPRSD